MVSDGRCGSKSMNRLAESPRPDYTAARPVRGVATCPAGSEMHKASAPRGGREAWGVKEMSGAGMTFVTGLSWARAVAHHASLTVASVETAED